MPKPKSTLLASAAAILLALPLLAQVNPPAQPRPRVSPHETVSAIVDNPQRVIIVYGRPYSKEPRGNNIRKIWGTLVPWGKVWRMGSDEATLLITPEPLQFGDVTVPAGACSVYMLPDENGTSKIIFNKKVGQWGINNQGDAYPADMNATEIGRADLKKDPLSSQVDEFTIAITPKQGGGGGTLKLFWENTMYSVDFTVKK